MPFEVSDRIKRLLTVLPDKPGVYLMKDESGEIIYVGKAIVLKNRVRQYFHPRAWKDRKTGALVRRIHTFETIVTDSEVEALVLESTLIKRYRPHYNILLKDDKNFPYVRIDLREDFPRAQIVRKKVEDGAKYFGPFISAFLLRAAMDALMRTLPLRTCNKDIARAIERNERPCLNYQIGRCLGPCTGTVTREQYAAALDRVLPFLAGRDEGLKASLTELMQQASDNLDFEKAARYRDTLLACDQLLERQKAVSPTGNDHDIFAVMTSEGDALVQGIFIRDGKMVGSESFFLTWEGTETQAELIAGFLQQYYVLAPALPRDILVNVLPYEDAMVAQYLSELAGVKVTIAVPQRGEKRKLVELAMQNAQISVDRMRTKARVDYERHEGALVQLADVLELCDPPRRIECYDISNTQGTDSVGSMVVFVDGRASNKDYRRFKIKTVEGANDFASIKEVVTRRLNRVSEGKGGFEDLPDLMVIDGGKGQLAAACEALQETGFPNLPIIGLAKRIEEIFRPNEPDPILLSRTSTALHLLQRIRDEAHRFAITYHRKLRTGRTILSELDNVSGVGKKRRTALIRHFGALATIRQASFDEIAAVDGVDKRTAQAVYEYFHPGESS